MVDNYALTHLKIIFVLFLVLIVSSSCNKQNAAEKIVNKCIEHHGGKLYNNIHIEFDFRNRHYVIHQDNDKFTYKRIFKDSTDQIRDVLDNEGFRRFKNDSLVDLSEEWKGRYSRSVNSVAYFSLLPHGLNDDAVIKSLAGKDTIDGQPYHLIHVSFKKEGGGEDHEDEFMYWINTDTYRMDYFAYLYYTDGGGTRFRKAVNVRKINGIILSDYLNYGFDHIEKDLQKLSGLYKQNKLKLVSEIRLKNIIVKPIN